MNCEQEEVEVQLKPQDILVLLKITAIDGADWSYRGLAQELFISVGEVHNSLDRATRAHLFDPVQKRPRAQALEEFLVHGVRYAFPSERGTLTRGTLTAYAAPPLDGLITASVNEQPPVWPDPQGMARGYELSPLYSSVPQAARVDRALYELLALVDAIRDGRARERKLAVEQLHQRLRTKIAKT